MATTPDDAISDQQKLKTLLTQTHLSTKDEESLIACLKRLKNPNMLIGPMPDPALIFALNNNNIQAAEILIQQGADKKYLSMSRSAEGKALWIALMDRGLELSTDQALLTFLLKHDLDQNFAMAHARGYRFPVFMKAITESTIYRTLHLPDIELKDQKSNEELLEARNHFKIANIIKSSGHILGYTQTIHHTDSTAYFDFESYNLLKKYLSSYSKTNNKEEINRLKEYYFAQDSAILQALNLAIDWLTVDGLTTHQHFMDHHAAGKITILPTGWEKHACTIAVWNDVLIFCNRGKGALESNISVFKIPAPGKITSAFLKSVMPEIGCATQAGMLKGLSDFVDISNPITTFSVREQQHGTCTFVNLKSALFPLICFLDLFKSHPESTKFDSEFLQPFLKDGPLSTALELAKVNAKTKYKMLTNDLRDIEIDNLYNDFLKFNAGSIERKIYLEIFEAILSEHYGQAKEITHDRTAKILAEQQRFKRILQLFSLEEQKRILNKIFLAIPIKQFEENLETMKWLITQGADVNAKDKLGRERIVNACLYGVTKAVQVLIDLGSNIEMSLYGKPLTILAVINKKWDIVKLLIEAGSNVNTKNPTGATLLGYAASEGNLEMVQLLLQRGADIEAKDAFDLTPLQHAIAANQENVVQFLKEKQENKNATETPSYAPYATLKTNPDTKAAEQPKQPNVNKTSTSPKNNS